MIVKQTTIQQIELTAEQVDQIILHHFGMQNGTVKRILCMNIYQYKLQNQITEDVTVHLSGEQNIDN